MWSLRPGGAGGFRSAVKIMWTDRYVDELKTELILQPINYPDTERQKDLRKFERILREFF